MTRSVQINPIQDLPTSVFVGGFVKDPGQDLILDRHAGLAEDPKRPTHMFDFDVPISMEHMQKGIRHRQAKRHDLSPRHVCMCAVKQDKIKQRDSE